MGSRTRNRNLGFFKSPPSKMYNTSGTYIGDLNSGFSAFSGDETCIDTTMPKPYTVDHDLRILRRKVEPVALQGSFKYWNGGFPDIKVDMNNHIPGVLSNPFFLPAPPEPLWNFWQTKAIANASPLNPDTGIPLFLFEFKDFPEMLHHAGRVLARRARASDFPGSYLAFHFGWGPLVQDLRTLFDLAKKIDDRSRYLRDLERGRRVKRLLRSGFADTSYSPFSYTNLPAWPEGWIIKGQIKYETYVKVWYTASAKLNPGISLPKSNGGIRALSARQSLGLTNNPAQIWDFLPWTWLIDYFANVGDFMRANLGQTYVQLTRMNLMHEAKIVATFDGGVKCVPGVSYARPYSALVSDKRRHPVAMIIPWLTARPFLGAAQNLALESLITARAFDAAAKAARK